MTIAKYLYVGCFVPCAFCFGGGDQPTPSSGAASGKISSGAGIPGVTETKTPADMRYDEMLTRMQTAVEEIAELYGNPIFLQVFTNDEEQATELRERLRADQRTSDIRTEVEKLEKRKADLLNDIALKEKQATKLGEKLVRQRIALDSLAAAVDQARRAVEESTR